MHPNPLFRHDDTAALDRHAGRIGFGSVFLTTPEGPRVAHTPLLIADDRLRFHLARGNALTRHLDGARALACVTGPDAYVSARWYDAPDQVSTWNYIALEYEGPVRRLGEDALVALLEDLTAREEGRIVSGGTPWTMDKLSAPAMRGLLRGIVGFEMTVEARRETVKLARHKPAGDLARLAAGVEAEGHAEMARLMREGLAA